MCLSPSAAFAVTTAAVVLQGLLVLCATFGSQWADCNMTFGEFSFGMTEFNVGISSGNVMRINLHNARDKMNAIGEGSALNALVTATDWTLALTLIGFICGIFAALLASFGMMKATPEASRLKFFQGSNGLLVADGLLTCIGFFVYTMGVMPNLSQLGVQDMIKALASKLTGSGIAGGILSLGATCSQPYMRFGAIATMMNIIILIAIVLVVGLGLEVNPKEMLGARGQPVMQMQMHPGGYNPNMRQSQQGYGQGPGMGMGMRASQGPGGYPQQGYPQPGYGGPPQGMPNVAGYPGYNGGMPPAQCSRY